MNKLLKKFSNKFKVLKRNNRLNRNNRISRKMMKNQSKNKLIKNLK